MKPDAWAAYWRKHLIKVARQIWSWSPHKDETIRRAKTRPGYIACAGCGIEIKTHQKPRQFNVDHIVPAAKVENGTTPWHEQVEGLLDPTADDLQCLCLVCHKAKTKAENSERSRIKREQKKKQNSPES